MAKTKKKKDFSARLKKMQSNYDKAEKRAGATCSVENGTYDGGIIGAELKDSAGGKLMIAWEYEVRSGDFKGEKIVANDMLETEQNMSFLKSKLFRLGVDNVEELDLAAELPGILESIVESEPEGKITVKSDGDFANVYLNGQWDWNDPDGDEEEEDEEEDEEEEKKKPGRKKPKKEEAEEEEDEDEEEEEDEDEEAPDFSKGDEVLYTPPKKKKAETCTIVLLNAKAGTAKLKSEAGKVYSGVGVDELEPVEAEEDEDEEEEMAELEKGSKVEVTYKKKQHRGVVTAVNEDAETCKVKVPKIGVITVGFDAVELLSDEE